MTHSLHRAALSLLLVFAVACSRDDGAVSVPPDQPSATTNPVERFATNKPFEDVIFELNFAITERNFRITGRNTIGEGLRDRGYDDFPNVEVIHFCNLELAREVLLIDLGFVAQMPCRITVHEQQQQTIISLILLPTTHPDERVNAFARRMNTTLKEIVDFALEPAGG